MVGYGGAQRIVVWLAQGLAELGHDVTVVGAPGTAIPGLRCRTMDPDRLYDASFDVRRVVPEPVDIWHFHAPLTLSPSIPYVHTQQGNMGGGGQVDARAICVSENHAQRHGTRSFVHNAVRLEEYRFEPSKDDFDLFLARLHRVKGWRTAVAIARRCKIDLVVAGGWRPVLSRYVRFVGEVSGERKRELLARARCLWMPVEWDDPCPINVLEALASGTPVIGTPRGSLRELVEPDGGGIGATEEELVALRRRLDQWDPRAVRARAERCFSHLRMAREYVRMYEHLLAHGSLPPGRRPDAPES